MTSAANRHRHHHRHRPLPLGFFIAAITLMIFPLLAHSIGQITTTQLLRGGQTLVSAGQEFELGFFPSDNPNSWYVGIWYKKTGDRTVVWVANRDSPVTTSSGILKISPDDGNLLLVDESGRPVWSSNYSKNPGKTVAELLDNGNLVLRQENDGNPENYLWQSFDHPTDTLLPGMKLGWDSKTGLERYITSWKSPVDPSSGNYIFKLNIHGFPEIYLLHKQVIDYRSGPWNGLRFSGVPEMKPSPFISFLFVMEPNEVSYSFHLSNNSSVYSRLVMRHTGSLQRFTWIPTSRAWNLYWYAPKDQCDDYRECGVYGVCDTNASPVCKCLRGFEPKNPQAWNLRDGSDGCVRVRQLDCPTDGFLILNNVKLPESGAAFVDKEMELEHCRDLCLRNCSCRGYSSANITAGGSGCVMWSEDLYDMRQYAAAEGGQDFFLRVAVADLGM